MVMPWKSYRSFTLVTPRSPSMMSPAPAAIACHMHRCRSTGRPPMPAESADVVLRLWEALRPRLRLNGSLALYEQVERRLVPILLEMERAGIKVDADDLRRMSVDFESRMAVMEQDCHRLAGHPFNVGSPKQLGEVLFDEQKLPGGKRMKTGAWGTNSAVLQTLAEQGHELPNRILEWRQLAKLKSTYANSLVDRHQSGDRASAYVVRDGGSLDRAALVERPEPAEHSDPHGGRQPHSSRIYRGTGACAGQRGLFSNRAAAIGACRRSAVLRDSFANGEDIHARTASEVFGVPMAGMDPMTRRRAKAINFGIIYGISGFGLARQLGITPGEARNTSVVTSSAIREFVTIWNERRKKRGSRGMWSRHSDGAVGCRE